MSHFPSVGSVVMTAVIVLAIIALLAIKGREQPARHGRQPCTCEPCRCAGCLCEEEGVKR